MSTSTSTSTSSAASAAPVPDDEKDLQVADDDEVCSFVLDGNAYRSCPIDRSSNEFLRHLPLSVIFLIFPSFLLFLQPVPQDVQLRLAEIKHLLSLPSEIVSNAERQGTYSMYSRHRFRSS